MCHTDRRQSHLVQPGPLSTVINCPASVPVSYRHGIFQSDRCSSFFAKFAVTISVVFLSVH